MCWPAAAQLIRRIAVCAIFNAASHRRPQFARESHRWLHTSERLAATAAAPKMPGLIGVSEFLDESREDYSSPTTSSFVSRMPECRQTIACLEEVSFVFICVVCDDIHLENVCVNTSRYRFRNLSRDYWNMFMETKTVSLTFAMTSDIQFCTQNINLRFQLNTFKHI